MINIAAVKAMAKNNRGNLEEEDFQNELNKEMEDNITVEVMDIGEEFEVLLIENSRYYIVDKNGNVSNAREMVKDNSPADITTGKDGEELEGRYEIWSIEDLVVLSNISRGKGNYLKDGEIVDATRDIFSGDTIYLMRTLNFNSAASYSDLSMTWSYDAEENAYIIDGSSDKNLRELLTDKEGVGFTPISEDTGSGNLMFAGIFDGQNNEIQNLYENGTTGGLFNSINRATIKNLGLTNVDINNNKGVGGITNISVESEFYNCYVTGNISGSAVGALIGSARGKLTMINCYSTANIQSTGGAGGLINYNDIGSILEIVNCYNSGNINSNATYNNNISGIMGKIYSKGTRNIINTLSMGNLSAPKVDEYTFYFAYGGATVGLENAYYLNSIVTDKTIINENSMEFTMNDEEVLNNLNQYVNTHKNDYEVELYNWTLDSNGLPTFEI